MAYGALYCPPQRTLGDSGKKKLNGQISRLINGCFKVAQGVVPPPTAHPSICIFKIEKYNTCHWNIEAMVAGHLKTLKKSSCISVTVKAVCVCHMCFFTGLSSDIFPHDFSFLEMNTLLSRQFQSAHSAGSKRSSTAVCALGVLLVTFPPVHST